jgi:hypothetical protein
MIKNSFVKNNFCFECGHMSEHCVTCSKDNTNLPLGLKDKLCNIVEAADRQPFIYISGCFIFVEPSPKNINKSALKTLHTSCWDELEVYDFSGYILCIRGYFIDRAKNESELRSDSDYEKYFLEKYGLNYFRIQCEENL